MKIDNSVLDKLKELLSSNDLQDKNKYLLINIISSGCFGSKYSFSWLKEEDFIKEKYELIKLEEKLFVIYPIDLVSYFKGSTLKYIKEGLNLKLVIDNPNVIEECGCGESIHFNKM